MAMLVLGAAGAGMGSGFAMAGLGLGISAAMGAFSAAGSLPNADAYQVGPRLEDLKAQSSAHGAMIPLVYGITRVAGNVIWGADITAKSENVLVGTTVIEGGKSGRTQPVYQTREFYVASFAVSLANTLALEEEGSARESFEDEDELTFKRRQGISAMRRIWMNRNLVYDFRANNRGVNGRDLNVEIYLGGEDQAPDELIESIEGIGLTPAYRDHAYLRFDTIDLSRYGNRLPNVEAEVIDTLGRVFSEEGPHGLAEGLDGDIYVVNRLQRTVTRIDGTTFQIKATIGRSSPDYLGNLDAQPVRAAVSPVDGHLWVTCHANNTVQRIHPAINAIIATVNTGIYPWGIKVAADGFVWITCPWADLVQKINPATNSLVANYTVAECPTELAFGLDGDLWVTTNEGVVRLNSSTGAVKATIPLGFFPWGIAVNPVNGFIWVVVNGQDILQVINPATNAITKTLNHGTNAMDVSIHPLDPYDIVWSTSYGGNRVRSYSPKEGFAKDGGYLSLIQYGTVAFPGQVLALRDGRFVVTQTKYDFVLIGEGY